MELGIKNHHGHDGQALRGYGDEALPKQKKGAHGAHSQTGQFGYIISIEVRKQLVTRMQKPHLVWLEFLYIEIVLFLKEESPFKSILDFYRGIHLSTDEQNSLEASIRSTLDARKIKVSAIEAAVVKRTTELSPLELIHYASIYLRFARSTNASVRKRGGGLPSPFTGIREFFEGTVCFQSDLNRLEAHIFPSNAAGVIERCEQSAKSARSVNSRFHM